LALLFPDAMVAALMRDVERMANDPLPQAARQKRIAALEHEIEQLAYVEEPLVAAAIADGEDVQAGGAAGQGRRGKEFARRLTQGVASPGPVGRSWPTARGRSPFRRGGHLQPVVPALLLGRRGRRIWRCPHSAEGDVRALNRAMEAWYHLSIA
jgi:hypothetical protein